jgi:MerR family transcriptional regulator, light-induced transcriptional regulator
MQLREAADTLGVHYQTAYGWVRQGVLPARKVGRGYDVQDTDVQSLAVQRAGGREPPRYIAVRDWAAWADRLYWEIVLGDETQARRWLDGLAGTVSLLDLCDRVFAPALRLIGDNWVAGRLSIAEEHRASAICERLLATRAQQLPGRPHGTAIVATPPGERHALPALMAVACLREDRWLVHHLATDLPVAEASRLALGIGASLIVFSTAAAGTGRRAADAAREITAAHPELRVLVGQPGDSLHQLRQLARNPRGPHVIPAQVIPSQVTPQE